MGDNAGSTRSGAADAAFSVKPPRGTHDILPRETDLWQVIEATARQVIEAAGYREVRVPIFEHTEVFKRGVGETTDIVNKEMYTFLDKSERSLTLRPEATAGVVRAYLNGGLTRTTPPVKLYYLGPMFRYERAQAGRQRQFHQVGIEAFGSAGPLIDAEALMVAIELLSRLGAKHLEVQLNSIGCPACRPAYRQLLKASLEPNLPSLCDDCQDRFKRNPLRMLDCKSVTCQSFYRSVPFSLDHLCQQCREHWQGLIGLIQALEVDFTVNKRLVRGLDYYTRTVFEIVSHDERLGSQNTVLAGGRYDQLVEAFGGPPTPAVGWALGLERLYMLLDRAAVPRSFVLVVSTDPGQALAVACELRRAGIACELDFPTSGLSPRSFTKQLKQADKLGVNWAVILGDDEIACGEVTLKNMQAGSQTRLPRRDLVAVLKARADDGSGAR